jgi:endonuclease YncB( thermonuclease family)
MLLGFNSLKSRTPTAALTAAAFALGVVATNLIRPSFEHAAVAAPEPAATSAKDLPRSEPLMVSTGYPADVLRVLDGDTFEARVRVWPGLDITTKVRLRGIDAPELKARCGEERQKAEAARTALADLLARGEVGVSHVSLDKYGGRVVADASARDTASIAEALFAAGHVRRYGGGRREGWCGGRSF